MSGGEPRRAHETGWPESVWYFAYGANMSSDVFVRRRGMTPLSSEAARLDGYRLAFSTRGLRILEPAFANIEEREGASVHGVLHHLSADDLERLDRDEGSDYRHIRVEVCGASAGRVSALAYQTARPVSGRKPSRRYQRLLLKGAEEFELPEEYRRQLAALPTHHIPVLSSLATPLLDVAMVVRRWVKRASRPRRTGSS